MARILITGATGFIGRHLAQALRAAGHDIVAATRLTRRTAPGETNLRFVETDFTRDHSPDVWLPRLAGIDVVINTAGILRQDRHRSFEAIHVKAPRALFEACVQSGVKLIVQFSALGADENAQSRYHRSKRDADHFLARLPIPHVIVQPSLVYGTGGTSARLFSRLASAPVIPLPGNGDQPVQPIHIDDVTSAVVKLIGNDICRGQRIALVGPAPMTLREFLSQLRHALGLGKPRFLRVPLTLVRAFAKLGALTPACLLDEETLAMLMRGNTADAGATRKLLGHAPRPVTAFIDASERDTVTAAAKLQWLLPSLRITIALVWMVSGIVSFGIYPVEDSYALLARAGIGGWLAPVFLYASASMDVIFGVATLVLSHRRVLWLAQIAVIVVYTVIITFKLPEFWLHPYGPVLKNLPMLAAIWLLYELEQR